MAGLATDLRPAAPSHGTPAPESPPSRRDPAPAAAGLIALVGGLVAYLATAAPSVQGGDSGEFQFVAYILGIPHPPGYPFYAVFGKLWTLLLPLGEIAWRMNAMSAAFAAAALAAVAWTGARLQGGRAVGAAAGLAAALWLAFLPTWWSQAAVASVRPPTGFFVAAVLGALAAFAASRRPAWLYAAAGLYGLGLTHHISLYTFAPAVGFFALAAAPRLVLRRPIPPRAALAAGLPLLLYLYLPVRSWLGTEFDASHPTTPDAFFALVTARGFAGDMLFFDPLSPERLELGRQVLLTNFDVLGLVLAALGGLAALARRPGWFLLTAGVVLINLAISLSYRAPVIADYLIPTYVVAALWIGELVGLAASAARRLGRPGLAAAVALAVAVLISLPPLGYARGAWSAFDLSADLADRRFMDATFAAAAPDATVLTDWYHATILWYGQLALGQRRDLRVEYVAPAGAEVPWLGRAEQALGRGAVYATALDRRLGERYHLQRLGPLYRVDAGPSQDELPGDAVRLGLRYGDAVELVGYRSEPPPDGADAVVWLFWRAHAPVGRDLREFVHLADASGVVWGQRDGTPGEGLYPTSRWRPGELVAERHALTVAPTAPVGELDVRVGLYETLPAPPGWRRLEARRPDGAPAGDAPVVGRVAVRPLVVPPDPRGGPAGGLVERALGRVERLVRGDGPLAGAPSWAASSGRLWLPLGKRALLTGWAVDRDEAAPGEALRVGLDFLPLGRFPEDAAVFVHLVDAGGQLRAQSDSVPVAGGLPTLRWAPGRPVRDTRVLRLPPDLAPGVYQLRAGMYVMATGAHLPVLDDRLAREGQGEHVVLTPLRVRP